jgi:hypothetical protein
MSDGHLHGRREPLKIAGRLELADVAEEFGLKKMTR